MDTCEITSIEALVERLGGTVAAARAFDAKHPSVVSMWIKRGSIPARLFMQHQEILRRAKITAPPSLWFGEDDKPERAA